MPEHTIPDSIIENIRGGRAALVIGSAVGGASWKQVLERLNGKLAERAGEGDADAARDVEKLLHKGNLVRAAGFLGRALGRETCDAVVREMWGGAGAGELCRAIARLPIRQVWTTFPGDAIEAAMAEASPEGWPAATVSTYAAAGFDRRRRTVLKLFGDLESYVVTPRSIRQALSTRGELFAHLKSFYAGGSLIFVGFRHGDPDLAGLLDRVLGVFEPTASAHVLVASGIGPVAVDELRSEHDLDVIHLAGKGGDDTAAAALLEFLEALRARCEAAGVDLIAARPDADDVEGWIAVLHDDPSDEEARTHLAAIEAHASDAGDWERLVEVLMARTETEATEGGRAALLRQVADVFESRIGDLPRALTALTAALREHPADGATLDLAERLAASSTGDAWTELVTEVSEVARELTDRPVAARLWARLGGWYHKKLGHHDYAVAAYREALKLDDGLLDARRGLVEVLRLLQRWPELGDELGALAALEHETAAKIELQLALGDLLEHQLAAPTKAAEAYQAVADLDGHSEPALAALERLYRKGERWGNLARVLEQRAVAYEAGGEPARAAATRRELATLRAERLGDLEGAIARYEAALSHDERDVAALRALEELYDKVGRTADLHRTLERLIEVTSGAERQVLIRRLAAESEDRGDAGAAIAGLERALELEPGSEDVLGALARLLRGAGRARDLVDVLGRHAEVSKAPAARAELYAHQGEVYERELSDAERAIEAHQNALAVEPGREASLEALIRLHGATGDHHRAIAALERLAALGGPEAAARWAAAGEIALERLGDPEIAGKHFDRALTCDAAHVPSLRALARLAGEQGSWATAASRLAEAAQASASRRERIELLLEAATVHADRLEDPAGALRHLLAVLELEPENLVAGERALALLSAETRWEEALPIAEMLARKTEGEGAEKARREAELGRIARALGHLQKAARHYRVAVATTSATIEWSLALAEVLFDLAREHGGEERWQEVDQRHRDVLARYRSELSDPATALLWHRLGVAGRALRDERKAEAAFRRALERDAAHLPTLEALVELAAARGDHKAAIATQRELLRVVPADQRVATLEKIGATQRGALADPAGALATYLEAVALEPDNLTLLHYTLELYSELKQWRPALATLDAIAAAERDPRRRSRYRYAAAVIARDELNEPDRAIEHFSAALDDDATLTRAFDALDQLCTDRGDWKALARQHRRMLKRIGEDAPADQQLRLWSKLGAICADHLGDHESAMAALEVAASIAPDDLALHEQLADLYLDAGEARRRDAIGALHRLLAAYPERVELYRALATLYLAEGETDQAFCLAQALVFLKAATPDEEALYARHRPERFVLGRRRLTEEVWQKAILHPKADRHISAIFASTLGGIAGATAQPTTAFNLAPEARVDLERDDHLAARMFRYASHVLAIEPAPQLYWAEGDGFRVANTADGERLSPSVLAGAAQRHKESERELAFEIGKRLAYLRPEHYVNYAVPTLPRLENAFYGALAASGYKKAADVGEEAARVAGELERTVPSAVLDQVAAIAKNMGLTARNGVVVGWQAATDLTANRVGLILCNDLETAARMVATESGALSNLPVKERLRDLVAYSVSEAYFAVRKHLGLGSET